VQQRVHELVMTRPEMSARALILLGATDIDRSVFERTMSIIVKHRTDLDVVAERVGVRLDDGILGQAERG